MKKPKMLRHTTLMGTIVIWIALVMIHPISLHAANVTVGCAGATGTFDYSNITDALNALHAVSPRDHQITVSGTCSELVTVSDFENLRLIGTAGRAIADPGPSVAGPGFVLSVVQSTNVLVQGFTLRGSGKNGRGVGIVCCSNEVDFQQCTFQQGNTGLFLNRFANASMEASTVQNNALAMRISGQSVMTIGSLDPNSASTVIQGNDTGVQVDENAQASLYGSTMVENNSGVGVNVQGARLRLCCDSGQRQVLNNLIGIVVSYGSVDMIGPALIQGNSLAGIQLFDGSATLR